MNRPDSTHHHGPLAGVSAGAAAVVTGALLLLIAARRQLGEVATVIMWALMAAVVGAVIAAAVYVFLWLRHRVRYPETLARQAIRAEVMDEAPPPAAAVATARPAAIEPPRLYLTDDQFAAIMQHYAPGTAGDVITKEE